MLALTRHVPGPVLKVVQGDEVKIDLINHTKDAHGINVHAAQISPEHFDGDPMKSVSYSFPADVPGVFIYHCTAAPILDHIASGMYGMMIVEPKAGWPRRRRAGGHNRTERIVWSFRTRTDSSSDPMEKWCRPGPILSCSTER